MSTLVCPSCGGTGLIKEAPNFVQDTNPTRPVTGRVLGCTSCNGTGIMRTFYPQ